MDILKTIEKTKRKHFSLSGKKIRCTLTGHELPISSDALLSYANGKKFERALVQHSAQLMAPAEHKKFLVVGPSSSSATNDPKLPARHRQLFCQLTCRFVSDTPADIARHLSGRRFKTALADYEAAFSSGIAYRPKSSLYAKYKKLMTLEGLAVAAEDEEDSNEDRIMEDYGEGSESEEVDDEQSAGSSAAFPPFQDKEARQSVPEKRKRKQIKEAEVSSRDGRPAEKSDALETMSDKKKRKKVAQK